MIIFLNYLKMRLNPLKFISLAILLSLLVLKKEEHLSTWITGVLFIFISLFVFRCLDDAGSVYFDRKNHLDRTYLYPENYRQFLVITGCIVGVYFLLLNFFLFFKAPILFLVIGSIGVYVIFHKNKAVLYVLPLLKYPILVAALHNFSMEIGSIAIYIASLLLLLSFDTLETMKETKNGFLKAIVVLLFLGILLFKPWETPFNVLFIFIPLLLIPWIKTMPKIEYMPFIYYPLTFFLLTNL